jgi:hypothetical protein
VTLSYCKVNDRVTALDSCQLKLRERQEKTVPLLAQFKAWLDHAVHTVAVERKAFPFVGSERAGHAAAIGKKR